MEGVFICDERFFSQQYLYPLATMIEKTGNYGSSFFIIFPCANKNEKWSLDRR
jgi:hypothetical protein